MTTTDRTCNLLLLWQTFDSLHIVIIGTFTVGVHFVNSRWRKMPSCRCQDLLSERWWVREASSTGKLNCILQNTLHWNEADMIREVMYPSLSRASLLHVTMTINHKIWRNIDIFWRQDICIHPPSLFLREHMQNVILHRRTALISAPVMITKYQGGVFFTHWKPLWSLRTGERSPISS